MKNFDLKIFATLSICLVVSLVFSCNRSGVEDPEEIAPAKAPAGKNCFTVCDINKNPDLQLVINAEEDTLYPDGIIDSSSYFWTKYHVRTNPIRLTQNYLTRVNDAIRYGWDSGVVVNKFRFQCLVENIAPFDSTGKKDWHFNEAQGYISPLGNYFFDGLFEFDTYEKGNGNSWKYLSTHYKKEFNPSSIPTQEYVLETNFKYYYSPDRAVQAQMGDFYYNDFIVPNHDGIYKIVLKFNPVIKGCRAIKETNYTNNEKTVYLEIIEGTVKILNQ